MAAVVLSESEKEKFVEYMVNPMLQHVKDDYVDNPEVRKLTIPRTGDTALHVAASDGWECYAEEMVSAAERDELAIPNVQGDTALHMAAKSGSAFFCRCIARKDVTLVGEKNESGETPLFSAVSRGHTEAFLYLHHLCKDNAEILDKPETYTRNDGDTILHSAIFEGHYDVAYIIILKYKELVQQRNNDGLLPLHLLANKPEAFLSGLHPSRICKLIIPCVYIGDLANKLDLDKAPNPQLGWDAPFRPLKADLQALPGLRFLIVTGIILEHAFAFWIDKMEDIWKEGHGEINQGDEDDTTIKSWIRRSSRKIMFGCRYLLILLFAIVMLIHMLCIILGLWCYMLVIVLIRNAIVLVKKFSGYNEYVRVKHMKETCVWSEKVMNNLIGSYEKSLDQSLEETTKVKNDVIEPEHVHEQSGIQPEPVPEDKSIKIKIQPESSKEDEISAEDKIKQESSKKDEKSAKAKIKIVEKPMFDAAKHGISEMVLRILSVKSKEIFEVNAEKKNILMLAVEHRHNHLYNDLMNYGRINKTVLEQVDKNGNNLLHFAANLKAGEQFWRIRGAALHMHMEIKWYEYVKKSMPTHLVQGRNKKKQTPKEILQYSHKALIKEGRQWLTDTSQSCSLVAALIATVSFAASATVPGGLKQDTGVPSLENKPIFIASAISALVALSSSMVSVVMFLSILTSSFKLQDFRRDLPFKLLWGLVSLLISIFSMIISFFAGHYFVLKQEFNHQAALVYEIVCFILVALILYTFPLEFEIVRSTISTKPTK